MTQKELEKISEIIRLATLSAVNMMNEYDLKKLAMVHEFELKKMELVNTNAAEFTKQQKIIAEREFVQAQLREKELGLE